MYEGMYNLALFNMSHSLGSPSPSLLSLRYVVVKHLSTNYEVDTDASILIAWSLGHTIDDPS